MCWWKGHESSIPGGKNYGLFDSAGRGKLMYKCVEVIDATRPRGFILENVPGLAHQHKKCLKEIVGLLSLCGGIGYRVRTKLINSRAYGVPQSRLRLFIVGQRRDCVMVPFRWPKESALATNLADILLKPCEVEDTTKVDGWSERMQGFIDEATTKMLSKGVDVSSTACSVDVHRSPKFGLSVCAGYTQCLTRARAGAGGFYMTTAGRLMDIKEMARLQGFKDDQWDYKVP